MVGVPAPYLAPDESSFLRVGPIASSQQLSGNTREEFVKYMGKLFGMSKIVVE